MTSLYVTSTLSVGSSHVTPRQRLKSWNGELRTSKTVYRRYAIVSDADLRAASAKLAGTLSGTSTLLLPCPAV